jgi:hypothetical protein
MATRGALPATVNPSLATDDASPATGRSSSATSGPLPATSGSLRATRALNTAYNPKNGQFWSKTAAAVEVGGRHADLDE